jgi:hypothetical protein
MALVLDGTNGVTFNNSTTQAVAALPLTGGTLTGGLTVGGILNTGSTGQVQFPATQNASSDANTLDDYEEGTFTLSWGDNSGHTSTTNAYGAYIKIGKVVHMIISIEAAFRQASFVTSDYIYFYGMPFPIASPPTSNPYNWPLGLVVNFSGTNMGSYGMYSIRQNTSTSMQLQCASSSSATDVTSPTWSNIATSGVGTYIRGMVTYTTTA